MCVLQIVLAMRHNFVPSCRRPSLIARLLKAPHQPWKQGSELRTLHTPREQTRTEPVKHLFREYTTPTTMESSFEIYQVIFEE